MLSNLLLVMGMCFFGGGYNRIEQQFNITVALTSSSLLSLAIASLIIPTAFKSWTAGKNSGVSHFYSISLGDDEAYDSFPIRCSDRQIRYQPLARNCCFAASYVCSIFGLSAQDSHIDVQRVESKERKARRARHEKGLDQVRRYEFGRSGGTTYTGHTARLQG